MSVLIKNMEVPKNCYGCRFHEVYGYEDGEQRVCELDWDVQFGDEWGKNFKHPNCPLIVPGDLINEIIRELGLNCCYEMPSFWTNNRKDYKVIQTKYHKGYLQALEDVEKAVKQRVGWLESESEGE